MNIPTSLPDRPRRSVSAVLAFLVSGLCSVFFLPYAVPVAPTIADSYLFGFNNRAALAFFLLFVAAFAYWSHGLGLTVRAPDEPAAVPPMSKRLLWVTLAITAAITLAFWSAYHSLGAINEGSYLMDRLQHLAARETMYRDFEFLYGPTMLYLPLVVHRGLGLQLTDSYYLAWTLAWVGGVALLWLTVAWGAGTSARKNGIYLLAYLGFIFSTVSMGLNYTPLRFVGAPFFAVLSWRVLERRRSVLAAVGTALGGGAWVLFYSPEQGIAFLLGTSAFFMLLVERSRPGYWRGLLLLFAGEGLLAWGLVRTGVLHYMHGMAAGGYNLPLLPSLNSLVLLGLLIVAVCVLGNSLRLKRRGGSVEYLVLVSVFALPAAFGRCDPGHLFMNTVGAFVAAWTVISYRPGAGRWMAWSYVASALFLPLALYQANNFFMFPLKVGLFSPADPHPALRRVTLRCMERAAGASRVGIMLAKWRAAYPVVQASDVPKGQPLLAPLGFPSTLLLAGLPPITNGRYRGLGNVMAPYEVQEKVEELRTHPQQKLLFMADAQCPRNMPVVSRKPDPAFDHAARRELLLNLQPFYVPHVRHTNSLLTPVCAYIATHYRPTGYTGPFAGSEVWERVPGS